MNSVGNGQGNHSTLMPHDSVEKYGLNPYRRKDNTPKIGKDPNFAFGGQVNRKIVPTS